MFIDGNTKTKNLILCALFCALIAIGAFIQIPVPYLDYFTLQFFFVIMAGLLLGAKLGAISVLCYVALGLAGFPIFAAGGRISYVLRPSFGYLLGFIAAAFVTGILCPKEKNKRTFGRYFLATLAGFAVTYIIGIAYKYVVLNAYMGMETPILLIFLSCFPLDIPGDLFLCTIASLAAKRVGEMKK